MAARRCYATPAPEIAVTYLNAKAEPFVRPLAEQLESHHIVG